MDKVCSVDEHEKLNNTIKNQFADHTQCKFGKGYYSYRIIKFYKIEDVSEEFFEISAQMVPEKDSI